MIGERLAGPARARVGAPTGLRALAQSGASVRPPLVVFVVFCTLEPNLELSLCETTPFGSPAFWTACA